ncbi:hypothetical protein FB446DRAFT_478551 [Lentinula raphanica]|nr:hypothetical protein FB446DRAFT_478551 [Lentinula raphanica]
MAYIPNSLGMLPIVYSGLAPEIAMFRTTTKTMTRRTQRRPRLGRGDWYIRGISRNSRKTTRTLVIRCAIYAPTNDSSCRWPETVVRRIPIHSLATHRGHSLSNLRLGDIRGSSPRLRSTRGSPEEDTPRCWMWIRFRWNGMISRRRFSCETLKYLYLIFSESSLLPPQDIVFNTEVHSQTFPCITLRPWTLGILELDVLIRTFSTYVYLLGPSPAGVCSYDQASVCDLG